MRKTPYQNLLNAVLKWLGLFFLIGLAVYAQRAGLFEKVLQMIQNFGFWAAPVFLAAYIASCLLFFPFVIMTCAAGILFPLPLAVFLSLLGNSLGSAAALLIGRYGLRSWIQKKFVADARFQILNEALRREGFKMALLARLSQFFPFAIGNYLFGATRISVWTYASAAFIGTIPGVVVYTLIGHIAGSLSGAARPHEQNPLEWALLAVGIAASVFLSWYLKLFFERIFKDGKISKLE